MKYRFLGDSGLLVSMLGLGTWLSFEGDDADHAYALLRLAFERGVNFIDTAESYGDGASERRLGECVRRGVAEGLWTREDFVLSTKIFMGTTTGPNAHGLSRKHVLEGVRNSLQRMQLEYVDVVFCHRPDPRTPIEETVRVMNLACEIADRLGLVRPIAEQPQYNIFERSRVDFDYDVLFRKVDTGLTTFSPLAYSVLTGKYAGGVPSGSRLADDKYTTFVPEFERRVQQAEALRPLAEELGCSLAQLAIAWCVANERVSSVLLGASSVTQLDENLRALSVVDQMTPRVRARVEHAVPFVLRLPTLDTRYSTMRDHYVA